MFHPLLKLVSPPTTARSHRIFLSQTVLLLRPLHQSELLLQIDTWLR